MKRKSATPTGGGASPDQQRSERKNRQPAGKAGVSKKGHPSDPELLILGLKRLVALALNTKDPVSRLAGKILAYVDALIAADREKLCEANEAYRLERRQLGKLLRNDVWFPESPLYLALHRELWHCEFYRGELHCPLVQVKWGAEEYECIIRLPPLSLKSFTRWEKELWKLVKKHNPDLLAKLRQKADRKKVVPAHSNGVTKYVVRPLKLTWKLVRPQFRRHLRSIVSASG
jgi:hypothetical protein